MKNIMTKRPVLYMYMYAVPKFRGRCISGHKWQLKRFRIIITFMANSRNDNVTMFILHLPLTVFSFKVKFSSFALASP